MHKGNKIFSLTHKLSAIGMILALVWLTISTPFVFSAQQENAPVQQTTEDMPVNAEEDTSSPFSSTTEEKAPSSTVLSEEYLHAHQHDNYFLSIALRFHKGENAGTYIAYHGELHVPPPNAA